MRNGRPHFGESVVEVDGYRGKIVRTCKKQDNTIMSNLLCFVLAVTSHYVRECRVGLRFFVSNRMRRVLATMINVMVAKAFSRTVERTFVIFAPRPEPESIPAARHTMDL